MTKNRWIGLWLIAVAALHTVFAIVVFHATFADIIQRGVWNSIGEDPMRGAVAWFLIAGGFFLVCGIAIDALEKAGSVEPTRLLAWSLLLVVAIGIVLMPISGLWFMLPPVIGLFMKSKKIEVAS